MLVQIQRRFIYRPLRGAVGLDAGVIQSGVVRDVHVPTHDGLALHGWHAMSRRELAQAGLAQRPLVLFFPGNSGHRGCRQRDFELFTQIGADLLLVDYRGYGENRGKPCEASLAADAHAIWRFATDELQVPAERIVLFGGSLGGGVATRLAHELCERGTPPAGLILRATFTSMVDAAKALYPWLPVGRLVVDRFPSIERIAHVTAPLLCMHGARDRIVPIEQGRRLFAAALAQSAGGVKKRFVELSEAGHHDIIRTAWDEMAVAMSQFLTEVFALQPVTIMTPDTRK